MTMPPLENPFLGKMLVNRLTLAAPQQTKVTGQLLDIGIKASITGIPGMTLKDVADRITADELNHITTLSTAGNPAITGHYLSSLPDKYTGNTQLPDTTLRNTARSQPLALQAPGHTGNNQISGQEITHTGKTAGVTDTRIKATITLTPDGLSKANLAYLADGYKPNKGPWGILARSSGNKALVARCKIIRRRPIRSTMDKAYIRRKVIQATISLIILFQFIIRCRL